MKNRVGIEGKIKRKYKIILIESSNKNINLFSIEKISIELMVSFFIKLN